MGHVSPAVCQTRKDSWRWETTNSEYGKFYVRRNRREVMKSQEFQNDCSKRCEDLTDELQEAKAQLEKLKISCGRNICGPVRLQDTACQTSPTSPGPTSRKLYKTEKMDQYNGLERNDTQMLLDHVKEDHSHLVKRVRPKLPSLKLRNGRNNQGDGDDHDNGDMECCKPKMPLGCGLLCGGSGSGSRSSSSGSAKGRGPPTAGKRKILQKQGGAPKKQKGSMIKATSNLKHTAAGGANLPPSQRYTFYRNFGYAGQGAKTSKGWHSLKTPWMPT